VGFGEHYQSRSIHLFGICEMPYLRTRNERYVMCITLTDENFPKEVIDCPGLVLVEIFATWCGTCHIMAPIIGEVTSEFGDRIKVGRLDFENNRATARIFRIDKLPTFLFFLDGQPIDVISGIVSKNNLVERINRFLESK